VQMVKVDDVVLNILDGFDNVAQNSSVIGNFYPESIFDCSHGAEGVNRRSDPSYALRKKPGFAGIPSFQDQLDPPEHGAGTPRVRHNTIIHLDLNAQVSFNPSYRVNYDLCHFSLLTSSLSLKRDQKRECIHYGTTSGGGLPTSVRRLLIQ
jgi:hypothetical protein